MKLGILGGSFNPIHWGHLVLAEQMKERLSLDKVIFIPAYRPPHKEATELAPAEDRLKMVELATANNAAFEVSPIEIERGGPSYTVETLRALRAQYPGDELYYIVGADMALDLPSWFRPHELLQQARFVVAPRPGVDLGGLEPWVAERVDIVPVHTLDVSSSEIRRRLREGKSVRYLVPPAVEEYVRRKGLYGAR